MIYKLLDRQLFISILQTYFLVMWFKLYIQVIKISCYLAPHAFFVKNNSCQIEKLERSYFSFKAGSGYNPIKFYCGVAGLSYAKYVRTLGNRYKKLWIILAPNELKLPKVHQFQKLKTNCQIRILIMGPSLDLR